MSSPWFSLAIGLVMACMYGCKDRDHGPTPTPLDKTSAQSLGQQVYVASEPGVKTEAYVAAHRIGNDEFEQFFYVYRVYRESFKYVREVVDALTSAEALFGAGQLSGDCEDFAVGLLAITRVFDLSARVVFGDDEQGDGHAYLQVLVASNDVQSKDGVGRRLAELGTNVTGIETDHDGAWLTLETFPPGAALFSSERRRILVFSTGQVDVRLSSATK